MTTQRHICTHDLTALRLYFPANSRAAPTRFWRRLSAPALAQHLLGVARRSGIQQALLYQIGLGYLPRERLTHLHLEGHAMWHPQCLNLLDSEEQFRAFMQEHALELRKVRAVHFSCELPVTVPEPSSTAGP
ncbi:MAG: hypothetical protein EOP13_17400 [Pseudomonas sp.]|jgi:hypothetical protein|uniref:hypothetical protein n=1 Tax=Pseudomonas sp. TaxID=306 RepID=UPI0011FE503A|nr:hypothetical protein [Pseudomonas sp.]RZI71676.1 MAG: hypothetical protein EOP13_17400 [Pseudomonas sp.]